ncbi:dTMP kinase [Celerinatantimonas sp. YJH-8]|uniref:dTMP kinase n=1 Tax=Celerinatantimonas sp. YJH-8 TaxID=3228714 RepID=UPI0038C1F73D
MSNGQFLVIEGLEGAGKSTAIATVEQWLTQQNIHFISTREPGGTQLAEQLRDILKYYDKEPITAPSELLLMYAARSQLLENKIKPALSAGSWVIGDRHDLSSRAYQGGGRQIPMAQLDHLRELTLGNFRPNLTLYLDINPLVGLERARNRGELDRIEQQTLDFFHRAREVYLSEAKSDPEHIKVVDASCPLAEVQQQIIQILNDYVNTHE